MSTVNALNNLGSELHELSGSESSISLSSTKSSRNELSEALEKIRLSKGTISASTSSGEEKSASVESDIKMQQKILRLVQRETDRASTNIVMHVKYYANPLRIFLKTKFITMSMEDKMKYASVLKLSNVVKEDLVSDWNAKDFFGLKVLVKMYRVYTMILPMMKSNDEFMLHFKPGTLGQEANKNTIYYIFNYVMNPGYGYYTMENAVPLEHEVHQWLSTFLMDRQDILEEAGYSVADFQQDLIKKTAFELNILTSTIFKKPLTFKYFTSPTNIQKETLNAEETIKQLYEMYNSVPGLVIVAQQMMTWMNQDDDMTGQPRAVLGGCGWMKAGKGKKKRATKK